MADETAKKKAEPTTFFILEEQFPGRWQYRGQVTARDRDHAARLFYGDTQSDDEIKFVAVSIAAWKPRVRKVATKTTVTYDEAEPVFGVAPPEAPAESVETAPEQEPDPELALVPPAA